MRAALKSWGWLIIGVAAVSLVLYLRTHLGQLGSAEDAADRKRFGAQLGGNVSLCLLSLGVGWMCLPLSRRNWVAILGGFVCGAAALAGLVAASNVRGVYGPFRVEELARYKDMMFILAFFAVPVAFVAAAGFTVLTRFRSD